MTNPTFGSTDTDSMSMIQSTSVFQWVSFAPPMRNIARALRAGIDDLAVCVRKEIL